MSVTLRVWACLSLGFALIAACTSPQLAGGVRTVPLDVSAISLPDASRGDAAMSLRAQPRELLVVYFGYTSCPDICPTTMSGLGQAIRQLPVDLAARVDVAMVTLDPDRDTAERLTGYLAYFFARSHALRTTDAGQLATAAAAFDVHWEVEAHQPGEPYGISHTAVTYAVDWNGKVVVEWPFGMVTDSIRSDLAILLARQNQ
jgi:protein SCO1/2